MRQKLTVVMIANTAALFQRCRIGRPALRAVSVHVDLVQRGRHNALTSGPHRGVESSEDLQ